MTIDIFTKQEFENTLPAPFDPLGNIQGEWCYFIKIDKKVAIYIRSSVGHSGMSKDTGQDSIRLHLVKYIHIKSISSHNVYSMEPLGSKLQKYITRVPGWQKRLNEKIKFLKELRLSVGDCQDCSDPLSILKVKKEGNNKGRLFSKCGDKLCTSQWFDWIT